MEERKIVNVIEGTIGYTIKIDDNNHWTLEYDPSIENDIACMCISQHVSEHVVAGMALERKTAKGDRLKRLKEALPKLQSAHVGIKIIIDYMQGAYQLYKKREADSKIPYLITSDGVDIFDQKALLPCINEDGINRTMMADSLVNSIDKYLVFSTEVNRKAYIDGTLAVKPASVPSLLKIVTDGKSEGD